MSNEHAVLALASKHKELAGRLKQLDAEAEKVIAELRHIREAIRILNPDYPIRSIRVKRPYRQDAAFAKGEKIRLALKVLRQTAEPITVHELAKLVLMEKGVAEPDAETVNALRNTIGASLMAYQRRGLLRHDGGKPRRWAVTGEYKRWEMVN